MVFIIFMSNQFAEVHFFFNFIVKEDSVRSPLFSLTENLTGSFNRKNVYH